jgi:Holliday junction resolvasome RuvABC endonuclease subunit
MFGEEVYMIGIDPSSKGLAIAWVEPVYPFDLVGWIWYELDAPILESAHEAITMLRRDFPNALITIEDPMGPHPKTIAALHRVVGACMSADRSMNMINVSTWKKATVGKGNASKDEVREWVAYNYGIERDPNQDVCDAIGIAVAAAKQNARDFA